MQDRHAVCPRCKAKEGMVLVYEETGVFCCPLCDQLWKATSKGFEIIPTERIDVKTPNGSDTKTILFSATIPVRGGAVMGCPYCRGFKTVKHGFLYTKRGLRQRYECRSCGRTFYILIKKPPEGT